MTRDQIQSVHDDIAYMKALAQEGRQTPLLAGPVLVAASVIFGAANLGQWALATGFVEASPWAPLWLWIGAGVVFGCVLATLIQRMKSKPGFNSAGNRAVGTAWSAVGYGIFATWMAFMAIGFQSGDWSAMRLMPTIVFVAYGSAWIIAGAMTETRWMSAIGGVSYVSAVAMAWFSGATTLYLVFTIALAAVALVPGLILMRQEPAEVI